MLHLVHENGNVEHYLDFEKIHNHSIALYDKNNLNENSYIISQANLIEKLKTGNNDQTLPALYDSEQHGPLTNESFKKFGVSVMIFATSKNADDIKMTAQNIKNNKIKIGVIKE